MSVYHGRPDLSMKQPVNGGGMDTSLLYLYGTAKSPHKGSRTGGAFRGKLPLRCPMCNVKGAK